MKHMVDGSNVYISTGGRPFDPMAAAGDVIVFLHGSGQSHLGFQLQHRFFANRGWQVLSPDFPAHGYSGGTALTTIEAQAKWVHRLLISLGVTKAHIAAHSQGGLVALELAKNHPNQVQSVIFMATAMTIPVNQALLDMARDNENAAIAAMMDWGHGASGHLYDHTMPGIAHMVYGRQIMRQNAGGVLYTDLYACAQYTGGSDAADAVQCPSMCLLAGQDRMTPLKSGRDLAKRLPNNTTTELPNAGHMITTESPFAVNTAIQKFIT